MRAFLASVLVASLLVPVETVAQSDVLAQARARVTAGNRAAALELLAAHLAAAPADADARLLYGLVFSWEGRYDDARRELTAVLTQAPDYLDARVALMNVEFWSGRTDEARAEVRRILARDAGNQQARLVRQRLDARTRPWSAGLLSTYDTFDDGREPWRETALTLGRETPAGTVLVRASHAERFGLEDQQVEIEFYPQFRAGTYAYIGVGGGLDEVLYPDRRVGADVYQSLGAGFEVSVGYRRLEFAAATDIYLASLTKYVGNWMITGRAYHVPGLGDADAWSYHGSVRRYFGAEGRSFAGVTYSRGLSRDEVRSSADFVQLDSDTLRGQLEADLTPRLQLVVQGAVSRQERATRPTVRQATAAGGLTVRF